jgi:hypothetical protein
MYKTARSQRHLWGEKRRELQKQRRAHNIKRIVKRNASTKGYYQILGLHRLFKLRAGI